MELAESLGGIGGCQTVPPSGHTLLTAALHPYYMTPGGRERRKVEKENMIGRISVQIFGKATNRVSERNELEEEKQGGREEM